MHKVKSKSEIITEFGLEEFLSSRANLLSGGQKRRLGLAIACISSPDLLILDEPTTGLDLESKVWFWRFVNEYSKRGGTILLTTHDIYEVSAMSCKGLLLNQGRVLAQGSMEMLFSKAKLKKITFQSNSDIKLDLLADQIEREGNWYNCWTREPEQLLKYLFDCKIDFSDLQVERGSLEEVLKTLKGIL